MNYKNYDMDLRLVIRPVMVKVLARRQLVVQSLNSLHYFIPLRLHQSSALLVACHGLGLIEVLLSFVVYPGDFGETSRQPEGQI